MTLTAITVTGSFNGPDGSPLASGTLIFRTRRWDLVGVDILVPDTITATITNGAASIEAYASADGEKRVGFDVDVEYMSATAGRIIRQSIARDLVIPNTDPVELGSLLNDPLMLGGASSLDIQLRQELRDARDQAAASASASQRWAESITSPDGTASKSAKTWAGEAATSASNAATSETNAANSAASAAASSTSAGVASGRLVAATYDEFTTKYGTSAGRITPAVGDIVQVVAINSAYERVASGGHLTIDGLQWRVLPSNNGKADVRAFGCRVDGATDDTAAFQAALDSGLPLTAPEGEMLLTDSIRLLPGSSFEGAGGAALYDEAATKIRFTPATKRDLFVWKTAPTSYVFAGVTLTGFCVRGFGAGASTVLDLPLLYSGKLDFFAYAGFDGWMRVKRWIDSEIRGGCQGFNVFGIEFAKSGIGGASDVTTSTTVDAYVSQGPTAYFIGNNTATDIKISGVVESVDCALDQARGNVVFMDVYTENCPRTDTGAAFKVGKTGAATAVTTALHLDLRPGLGFSTGATPANCVLLDVDAARFVRVSGYAFLYGALLATTANTQRVVLSDLDTDNCPWLSLAGGIADMSKITMTGFRPLTMQTRGDSFFSEYNLAAPDLELFPVAGSGVTRRKMFVDSAYANKLRRVDDVGNMTAAIGNLQTTATSGWTFNGGRLTPGEVVIHETSDLGRPALWRSQRHTKDTATTRTLCTTTAGSPVITRSTGVSPFFGFVVGDWVTASAGFASTTTQMRVIAVDASFNNITLDTNATSSVIDTVTIATEAHNLVPIAQQGYRSGSASPAGSVTPYYIGEEYFATAAANWFKSTGLTSADWKQIT